MQDFAQSFGHGNVVFGGLIEQALKKREGGMSYDAVVSLGGNCSVAHNLRLRGLRQMSLPFDWLLMDDSRPIGYLARGFESDFADFCLKENLEELKGEERGQEHPGRLQFIDRVSGWKFIHHFNESDSFDEEYARVSSVIKRRIIRMTEMFQGGGRYLLVLAPTFSVEKSCLGALAGCLARKYPNADFTFLIMSFGEKDMHVELDGDVIYARIPRPQNVYDFTRTNFEWQFMDKLVLPKPTAETGPKMHKCQLLKWNGVRYVLRWFVDKKESKRGVE